MGLFVSHQKRGFTLVEIVVAIGIVAVLSTVVIMNIQDARKKGRDTQRTSDIGQLQLALRLYKDANSAYPDNATFDAGVVIGEGGALDAALTEYLASVVRDSMGSASDTTYEYIYDSDYTCPVAGGSKKVVYARTMERAGSSNWATVCGGVLPGTNTYGVILQ